MGPGLVRYGSAHTSTGRLYRHWAWLTTVRLCPYQHGLRCIRRGLAENWYGSVHTSTDRTLSAQGLAENWHGSVHTSTGRAVSARGLAENSTALSIPARVELYRHGASLSAVRLCPYQHGQSCIGTGPRWVPYSSVHTCTGRAVSARGLVECGTALSIPARVELYRHGRLGASTGQKYSSTSTSTWKNDKYKYKYK